MFNTEWVPANSPTGKIDGLGPLFNSQGCDACHNSRRRGRGPRSGGEAPVDLVVQLGQLRPDGTVQRGSDEYGFILNTAATPGFTPEARVWVRYEQQTRKLADGTRIKLRQPHYRADSLSGPPLPPGTVLMPRLPPSAQGVGLLELVPQAELMRVAALERRGAGSVSGRISWLEGRGGKVIGRFGWQASEPTVASQVAVAFAREMGLTSLSMPHIDCGRAAAGACESAPNGGSPEVEAGLFDAVVAFEGLHSVPVRKIAAETSTGARLFRRTGCADCHRSDLRVEVGDPVGAVIKAYTDLLVHDMGAGLADCDLAEEPARELWRTAPLWGMHAAFVSGQPLRLLHDGRATSIEEAILWHDAEGRDARDRFARLTADQRYALVNWIQEL